MLSDKAVPGQGFLDDVLVAQSAGSSTSAGLSVGELRELVEQMLALAQLVRRIADSVALDRATPDDLRTVLRRDAFGHAGTLTVAYQHFLDHLLPAH